MAVCPLRDGRAVRWCGCRPRSCSRRMPARCRWRTGCGSVAAALAGGGQAALASAGPGGCRCRLTGSQLARLRAALEQGPAAWGWIQDQRWTLPRVSMLIGRLCHVRCTPRGTSYLLHRMGFTPQVPVHRAIERDEAAIAAWRAQTWAKVRG